MEESDRMKKLKAQADADLRALDPLNNSEPVSSVPPQVAKKIIQARNAHIAGDFDEVYHKLYSIADPSFTKKNPWKELEDLAEMTDRTPTENNILNGKVYYIEQGDPEPEEPCSCGCGVYIPDQTWVVETKPGCVSFLGCFDRVWGDSFEVDTDEGTITQKERRG